MFLSDPRPPKALDQLEAGQVTSVVVGVVLAVLDPGERRLELPSGLDDVPLPQRSSGPDVVDAGLDLRAGVLDDGLRRPLERGSGRW